VHSPHPRPEEAREPLDKPTTLPGPHHRQKCGEERPLETGLFVSFWQRRVHGLLFDGGRHPHRENDIYVLVAAGNLPAAEYWNLDAAHDPSAAGRNGRHANK
jgi:hypothetical protein